MDKQKLLKKLYKDQKFKATYKDFVGATDKKVVFLVDEPIDFADSEAKTIDVTNTVKEMQKFTKTLELPDVKKYKADIKEMVGRKRAVPLMYSFGTDLPVVNAFYLLDVLEAINDDTACFYSTDKMPLYIVWQHGLAIICPIFFKEQTVAKGLYMTPADKKKYLKEN